MNLFFDWQYDTGNSNAGRIISSGRLRDAPVFNYWNYCYNNKNITMLVDLFEIIATVVMTVWSTLANVLLGWSFPAGVQEAINWLITPIKIIGSFFDIAYFGQMISYFMLFLIMWFSYKILRFALSMAFAWTGGKIESPKI